MKYKYQLMGMFASAVILAVACSSANFGGTTAAPSKTEDPSNKTPPSGDPNDPTKKTGGVDDRGPAKCSNDQVKLKLSSEQEKCIVEQGKTWDFKNNRCGNLPKADFPCDWANVIAKLSSYPKSLVTTTLQTASTDGSKLVTCGQGTQVVDLQSGKRYIRYAIQFVTTGSGAKQLECEGTPSNEVSITTGCYTYADNGADPITIPDSSDKAAYENYVYKCVDNLGPTP